MPETLSYEYFHKLLDNRFTVAASGAALELRLTECRAMPSPLGEKAQRQAFALMFHGPVQPILEQKIWQFEGGPDGPLEIFIVPVGPEGAVMRYEAIFT